MDHVYLDDEALEASDLSCLLTPAKVNSEAVARGFSESLVLTQKAGFLDRLKSLLGKKAGLNGSKSLLQQIQAAQSEDVGERSSTYRKTTRVWAFKIIPFKDPRKK